MSNPFTESMIAVDWGSTNFRAALISGGEIVDQIESGDGIKNVKDARFQDVLKERCGTWIDRHPDAAIVLSGMIGSREGWVEVPYVDAPASAQDLAANLTKVDTAFGPVHIVPGVRLKNPDGTFDVMRGEETQVFGLLRTLELKDAVIVAPGTHSKWIVCRDGRIESFRTWATGEAFQMLSQNSLLTGGGAAESIDANSDAFRRGLEHAVRTGGLLHHLFLGRTDLLMNQVSRDDLPSQLSGLLVGHEIREARTLANGPIHLIAGATVSPVYEAAFEAFGLPFSRCETDVHGAGVAAILRSRKAA